MKTLKKRNESEKLFQESLKVIPGGVNSPIRSFINLNISPMIVESGFKDEIVDVDGNHFVDFCGSWGALIHGHAHPQIVEAAQKRVALGSSFGITTKEEVDLAKKIISHMPSIEKIRFVSSGTEATMTAIRLARGFTKRKIIVKFSGHYHGHNDSLLVQAGSGVASIGRNASSEGVPEEFVQFTVSLPFNDFETTRNFLRENKVACVILEPIAANMGVVEPLPGFLEMLKEETEKSGALLIFDEVITGFRVGLKGVQGLFGIRPDLTTLGKIIGGGFPAAAFGGRAEVMDMLAPKGGVYQAGTLSGNPVAMKAGLEALNLLEVPGFYENLERKTKSLTDPIKRFILEKDVLAHLSQVGSMFTLFFGVKKVTDFKEAKDSDAKLFSVFFNQLFEKGIYLSPYALEANFISSQHSDAHLTYAREAIFEFLEDSIA